MADEDDREEEQQEDGRQDKELETGQGPSDEEQQEEDDGPNGKKVVSWGKYQRTLKQKDAEIARLTSQLDEASKSKEGREKLESDIQALKDQMADDKLNYELELAGCRNVKAAKAILPDFDGDVEALWAKLFDTALAKVRNTDAYPCTWTTKFQIEFATYARPRRLFLRFLAQMASIT